MSDLLEPFRRAAELGCPDFAAWAGVYLRGTEPLTCFELPLQTITGYDESFARRINRYAAAVCECWWREHEKENSPDECYQHLDCVRDATSEICEDTRRMIDLCREFGRKHGGQ